MITFFCILFTLGLTGESVTFTQDPRVDVLVRKHIEYNKIAPVNGFRINIFFQSGNNSRSEAMAVQAAFSERFPNINSYVSFEEPYFKVNVGNFRTRLEASAALENLKMSYPQGNVVRDALNVRNLLGVIVVFEEIDDDE